MGEKAPGATIWHYVDHKSAAVYGPWVRHADYQALTAERDALAAEVERLRGELTHKDAMLDAYEEAAAPLAKGVLKKRLAERRAAFVAVLVHMRRQRDQADQDVRDLIVRGLGFG